MRLIDLDPQPFFRLRYLNAARGGGTESAFLPFQRGTVEGLPTALQALVVMADLQGIVPDPMTREAMLLGVAVVDALDALAMDGQVPPLSSCGAVLAGDLFSVPEANKRGGFGDVAPVWRACARSFRWVAGVAGNHDDVRSVQHLANAELLDGNVVERDGLRIGGVGLVSGNPAKAGRRAEAAQLERIELTLLDEPNVLVLHEGPSAGDFEGHPAIAVLLTAPEVLSIFGHVPWPAAAADVPGQLLNVHERVLVLTRGP